jgi:cytochrome c551/c552
LIQSNGDEENRWKYGDWCSEIAFEGALVNNAVGVPVGQAAKPAFRANAATARKRFCLFPKRGMGRVGSSLLSMLVVLLIGQSAPAAQPSLGEMDELASAKGCYLCHRVEPVKRKPDDLLPYAPSWKDIALRYRSKKNAEDRLTEVVLGGSGDSGRDRHWKGKVSEVGMFPNVQEIDEGQARQLVHWILSFAP